MRSAELEHFLSANEAISLFLDFDGVLVEIAETPNAVRVPNRLLWQLARLNEALGGAIAIVSGRSLTEIDDMLQPVRVSIAGDHGNQRRRVDGEVVWLNPGAQAGAAELAKRLASLIEDDNRLLVEQKTSGVALHYRRAPERWRDARALLGAAVAGNLTWSIMTGKMVVEARASGANKGEAVRSYMREAPFKGRVPVFIGDDVTDEDGFAVVQAMGGAGIKVGPGKTCARFRIAGPAEIPPLLDRIAGEPEVDLA